MDNFKQGYDLERKGEVVEEFYRVIGKENYKEAEFIHSSIASDHVEKNHHLLEYEPIKTEMDKINSISKKHQEDHEKFLNSDN